MAKPQSRLAFVGVLILFGGSAISQQAVDPAFVPRIETPAYETGKGPRVLIDAQRTLWYSRFAINLVRWLTGVL
ncbi:MAG TPA: hypothetical protein VFR18_04765 [Terriglobia bacterium]|nr:hypothetical protein [Terriglobia bacterium]